MKYRYALLVLAACSCGGSVAAPVDSGPLDGPGDTQTAVQDTGGPVACQTPGAFGSACQADPRAYCIDGGAEWCPFGVWEWSPGPCKSCP